jgi:protein gp37
MDGQWWDEAWNPVTGCLPDFLCWERCWARRRAKMLAANPKVKHRERYEGFKPRLHPERLEQPLHWRKPRRIFAVDMGDLFVGEVEQAWVKKILKIIVRTPRHTHMILTKRPGNAAIWLPLMRDNLPSNLWLGISASTQEEFDKRWHWLRQIPVARRFVSLEPLLREINLCAALPLPGFGNVGPGITVDWVIAGGETGPGARPCHPDWVRGIRDQCRAAGVPFWFKQWGDGLCNSARRRNCESCNGLHSVDQWVQDLCIQTEQSGPYNRTLDGRTWEEV